MSSIKQRVLSIYRSLAFGTRLFLWIRWHLTFFTTFLTYLADRDVMVEIGCGYGLFCVTAALSASNRQIYGFDLNQSRVAIAQGLTGQIANLHFVADWSAVPPSVDAIAIIDVLYAVAPPLKEAILRTAFDHLKPNGKLIVKINGRRPIWKYWFAYLEELVMTRLGPSSYQKEFYFWEPAQYRQLLEQIGFEIEESRPLGWWLPQPHYLMVAQRPVL